MKLRPNNLQGQGKNIRHGHWLKRKNYVNQGFVESPELTEEERRAKLLDKKAAWSYKPGRDIVVGVGEALPEPTPSPTPAASLTPTPTPSATPYPTPTPSATPPEQFNILAEDFDSITTELNDNLVIESAPTEIPTDNMIMWYDVSDASTITESGGVVSQVNDKSSNGFNLTQSTEAYKPTLSSDAVGDYISFDGVNDRLINTTMTGYGAITGITKFFVFSKLTTAAAEEMIVQIGSTGRLHYYYQDYAGEEIFKAIDYPGPSFGGVLTWSKSPNYLNWVYLTKPSPYNYDSELNDLTWTSAAADAWGPVNFDKIGVGASTIGSNPCSFYLRELIIYEGELSSTYINLVENYLKTKWNYTSW
tara:strand:+ start:3012 stop:4097 length:1086 start_codon:yes stop_codon:yes gene_type:complete